MSDPTLPRRPSPGEESPRELSGSGSFQSDTEFVFNPVMLKLLYTSADSLKDLVYLHVLWDAETSKRSLYLLVRLIHKRHGVFLRISR